MLRKLTLLCLAVAGAMVPSHASTALTGVLLLAHGGSAAWDANVYAIARSVDTSYPTEVALGMATRANIQAAVERLEARRVTTIVAVPLFISSHSSVITSTEFLLGARQQMPQALHVFAKMGHGSGAHAGHGPDPQGMTPVKSTVPIRVTKALDAHAIVASIVADRAAAISRTPTREAVILVAHGPVADDENARWVENLERLAIQVREIRPFASVEGLTVRDDAPPDIRDAATRQLRTLVERRRAEGRTVLIVPVLLSFGGIEAGIRTRLESLDYVMSAQALAPDPRLADWVRQMVASTSR